MSALLVVPTADALALSAKWPYASPDLKRLSRIAGLLLGGVNPRCQSEAWNNALVIAEHLQGQHEWLIGCAPPEKEVARHGHVAILCWVDMLETKHGPTLTVPLVDEKKIYYCPTHSPCPDRKDPS